MTAKEKETFEQLGWCRHVKQYGKHEGPKWQLRYEMVVRMSINVRSDHKNELWWHVYNSIEAMTDEEASSYLSDRKALGALAATFLLTQ